jgi:NAD(P)-dependent dehydrogenase (short-subunit alcohol dehydrogenase family)
MSSKLDSSEELFGRRALVTGGTRGMGAATSFALNLFAAVRLTNAVLPVLRESKASAIVNISRTRRGCPSVGSRTTPPRRRRSTCIRARSRRRNDGALKLGS